MPTNISRWNTAIAGCRDSLPLVIAAMPFGVAYGAIAAANGISSYAALAMSVFVFAGASQLIAVLLWASGAPVAVVLLTVFIVNARHMLYAVNLMHKVKRLPQWLRAVMAFGLTDETFAVAVGKLSSRPNAGSFTAYYLGSMLLMYGNWALCTVIGMVLGTNTLDVAHYGLDVAMAVAFISIVVPLLNNLPRCACALVSSACMLITYDWPNQIGLLASSFAGIGVGLLLEQLKTMSKEVSCPSSKLG